MLGFEPGFGYAGFVDPPLGFVVDPGVPAPGVVFGLVPFGLLGLLVEGLPAVPGLLGFAPGSVFGTVEPVGGVVLLPVGGCAVPAVGGWPVFPVGGAEGDACPGIAAPPAGAEPPAAPAPPAPPACATTQVAQSKTTASNVSFFGDMNEASSLNFSRSFLPAFLAAERSVLANDDR